tara:strand:+ start:215336 stop:215773 length:438 start_codon:yes stop_codon:yes gene_type:complete
VSEFIVGFVPNHLWFIAVGFVFFLIKIRNPSFRYFLTRFPSVVLFGAMFIYYMFGLHFSSTPYADPAIGDWRDTNTALWAMLFLSIRFIEGFGAPYVITMVFNSLFNWNGGEPWLKKDEPEAEQETEPVSDEDRVKKLLKKNRRE